MNKGDIVIVPVRPCSFNDVVKVLDNEQSTYPVYAVIRSYDPDDPIGVLTEVYTSDGRMRAHEWVCKDKEVLMLEEAPEQAQGEVYALGA